MPTDANCGILYPNAKSETWKRRCPRVFRRRLAFAGDKREFEEYPPERVPLHIDDEQQICSAAAQYGFRVLRVYEEDDEWKEKIIDCAERVRKLEGKA